MLPRTLQLTQSIKLIISFCFSSVVPIDSKPRGASKVRFHLHLSGLVPESLCENTITLRRVSLLLARPAPVSLLSFSHPSMCVRCIKFTPIVFECVRKSPYHNCDWCSRLHKPCLMVCSCLSFLTSALADLYSYIETLLLDGRVNIKTINTRKGKNPIDC